MSARALSDFGVHCSNVRHTSSALTWLSLIYFSPFVILAASLMLPKPTTTRSATGMMVTVSEQRWVAVFDSVLSRLKAHLCVCSHARRVPLRLVGHDSDGTEERQSGSNGWHFL